MRTSASTRVVNIAIWYCSIQYCQYRFQYCQIIAILFENIYLYWYCQYFFLVLANPITTNTSTSNLDSEMSSAAAIDNENSSQSQAPDFFAALSARRQRTNSPQDTKKEVDSYLADTADNLESHMSVNFIFL